MGSNQEKNKHEQTYGDMGQCMIIHKQSWRRGHEETCAKFRAQTMMKLRTIHRPTHLRENSLSHRHGKFLNQFQSGIIIQ